MSNPRDLLTAHNTQAGKGDAERSPGWRDKFDLPQSKSIPGMVQVGPGRFRKVYGASTLCEGFKIEELAKVCAQAGALSWSCDTCKRPRSAARCSHCGQE